MPNTSMQYHKYMCWQHRKAIYTNFYLEPTERQELIRAVGVYGLVLFEYYLYLAKQKTAPELNDERAADYFGWSVRTAAKYRRALTKAGWFHVDRFWKREVGTSFIYHLGQSAVAEATANS